MWSQAQEMIHIEKGGLAQTPDEIAAYNPLIPNGSELTATFMVEIGDPIRRRNVLGALGGIEDTAFLRIQGEDIRGVPDIDQDRTTAEGKASSVQFVHFPLTPAQIAAFRRGKGGSAAWLHPSPLRPHRRNRRDRARGLVKGFSLTR